MREDGWLDQPQTVLTAPRTRPHMVVSLKWGYRIRDTLSGIPQNGWLILERPIKVDDLGLPLF